MATIDLAALTDGEFVLHFGGRPNEVDAFTFANSIIAISEALRAINREISPLTNVEIAIDAVGTGSFRARMKKVQSDAVGLLKQKSPDIAVGLLVAFIYGKVADAPMQIIVKDDSYVIQHGEDRVILPREIYEAGMGIKNREIIDKHVSRAFEVMEEDPSVTEFGITTGLKDAKPLAIIPRKEFPALSVPAVIDPVTDPNKRTITEESTVIVLRAVLEHSTTKKWQFAWQGIRISAPIRDEEFFKKLANHEYEFGQGDQLDVILAIHQTKDDISGVYLNEGYEIVRVKDHQRGPKQTAMRF